MARMTVATLGGALVIGGLITALAGAQGPATGSAALTGKITSADGRPLEGVVVSARAPGHTFSANVFTNEAGEYAFPQMAQGKYKVWSQAVGFEAARGDVDLSVTRAGHRDLTMRPLKQFDSQLTGEEWMASLPEKTPAERREKAIFTSNCTACHQAGFPLQNRFDAAGWGTIVDLMARTGGLGGYQKDKVVFPIIPEYKDELVAFLTRHRGPNSPALTYKLAPRPQGDAANAVIMEYDLPPGEAQEYFSVHNGTDWSNGTPSAYEGRSAHDVAIAPDGNAWFTDQGNPDRTLGMVDVKTGKVKGWKMARLAGTKSAGPVAEDQLMVRDAKAGSSVGTHSLDFDKDGNAWFGNATEGSIAKFVPSTEKFVRYPRPDNIPRSTGAVVKVDSKGNVWSLCPDGAIKLEPKSGKYTYYKSVTPGGDHYGMAIDSQDNAWWSLIGKDKIGYVDAKTGKVGELVVPPSKETWITDKDRTLGQKYENESNDISAVPQIKGPRRMAADPTNENLWVAEYFADRLLRVNIRTKEIKEYPAPRRYMQTYAVAVGKDHMVWMTTLNTDRLLRFDPSTERFTEFLLPTRGTEIRHIVADNRSNPPTIWVPYWRANKIASLQLRSSGTPPTR